MFKSSSVLKTVVLVGGGHAHVHTLKSFGMNPTPGLQIVLISRDVCTPYSGMLPGYIAGYYTKDECHIDLIKLCTFANARFIHAEACGLDVIEKVIYCKDNRPPICYDILSIDIGITPKNIIQTSLSNPNETTSSVSDISVENNNNNNINSRNNITPVKPIDTFGNRWQAILDTIGNRMTDSTSEDIHIAIIGGGGGGVELCFAIHHVLTQKLLALQNNKLNTSRLKVSIYSRGKTILPQHNSDVQQLTADFMLKKGITIQYNADIIGVEDSHSDNYQLLVAADGQKFPFQEAFVCTQASPQSWLRESGLELTDDGFICVQATLESTNVKDVFACGDVSHFVASPRPKAGVFAVRAGPILTENIRCKLLNQPMTNWEPQDQFLGIIGTGDEYAIASKGPMALHGTHIWTLKQEIDRTWMKGYQELPTSMNIDVDKLAANRDKLVEAVAAESGVSCSDFLAEYTMRCGACGSKASAKLLHRALSKVKHRIPSHPDVIVGIGNGHKGDDAAILRCPGENRLLVQTIDFFRSPTNGSGFASDPYQFGKIAANHALSDIHAMGADPVSALALCVLPLGPTDKAEEILVQLLAGACDVLREEGCGLVGGHTAEAAEGDGAMGMGFSVTGSIAANQITRKGPLKAGQVLILTKALGSGVLMAADMKGQVKGEWVVTAVKSMLQSNRAAGIVLRDFRCLSCTDITGFGLLGHLIEMLPDITETNAVEVQLELDKIPLLAGAADCAKSGVKSSLHGKNKENTDSLVEMITIGDCDSHPAYPLLWDPQTCGGLLAAVDCGYADSVVLELQRLGFAAAAVIGTVRDSKREEKLGNNIIELFSPN